MKKQIKKRGFSLVELLVATALFMIVVAVAAGSFLTILDASVQAREMNALVSNLDFALEDMSRNIRIGERFNTSSGLTLQTYSPTDVEKRCSISYRLRNGRIEKAKGGDASCGSRYGYAPITSPEINISNLTFTVDSSRDQPRVSIVVAGYFSDANDTFLLQTSVTQRILNFSNR